MKWQFHLFLSWKKYLLVSSWIQLSLSFSLIQHHCSLTHPFLVYFPILFELWPLFPSSLQLPFLPFPFLKLLFLFLAASSLSSLSFLAKASFSSFSFLAAASF